MFNTVNPSTIFSSLWKRLTVESRQLAETSTSGEPSTLKSDCTMALDTVSKDPEGRYDVEKYPTLLF